MLLLALLQLAGDPLAELAPLLAQLLRAVVAGDAWPAAAAACALLVVGVRGAGARLWPPAWSAFRRIVVTAVVTFALAVAGGIFNALGAGEPITAELLQRAVEIGAGTSGILAVGELALRRWAPWIFAARPPPRPTCADCAHEDALHLGPRRPCRMPGCPCAAFRPSPGGAPAAPGGGGAGGTNPPRGAPPPRAGPGCPVIRFHLRRKVDSTGVSGTGRVAEGVIFLNGKVALTWLTEHTSVALYDSIKTVHRIHGHGGHTEIVFDEPVCSECGHRWEAHWGDNCGACEAHHHNPGAAACQCVLMSQPNAKQVDGPLEVYDPLLPSERAKLLAESIAAGRP